MAVLMPLDLVRPMGMLVPERCAMTTIAFVRGGLTVALLLLFASGLSAALARQDSSRIGLDTSEAVQYSRVDDDYGDSGYATAAGFAPMADSRYTTDDYGDSVYAWVPVAADDERLVNREAPGVHPD